MRFSRDWKIEAADENIEGPFELHVIVEPSTEPELLTFLLSDPKATLGIVNPKVTGFCAFKGKHRVHVMLSCFLSAKVSTEAMKEVEVVEKKMVNYGCKILRVKVESLQHSVGVPGRITGDSYFEAHFKVPLTKGTPLGRWNRLVWLIAPFGANCFQNNRSKSDGNNAIVTLRIYESSLIDADIVFDRLKQVVSHEFDIISERKEYGFYDTNPMLDEDWLFVGDDYKCLKN